METEIKLGDKLKQYIKNINSEYKNNENEYIDDLEELDEWLSFHFGCDDDYNNISKQICVIIKDIKTNEFYNKFFDYNKLLPQRETTTPLSYLIYKLAQIEELELYIASNLFIGTNEPRRTQDRVKFSNVFYVDIDKVKGSENLDYNSTDYNKQLVELFYKNYEVAKIIPPSEIIASGSGLHLYFYIDNTFMFNKESTVYYKDILYNLTALYNGDFNCVDTARILRPINTYNKKDKFIKPKKVELMEDNRNTYTFNQLNNLISYCKEKLKDKSIIEKKPKIKKTTPLQEGIKKPKANKKIDDYFELTEYETYSNFPNQYLIQDLLYYISNREGAVKGARRNLIYCFYFAFRQYCLFNQEDTEKYCLNINNTYFKEPLKEEELKTYFEYLSSYKLYNGITNIKISNLLKFKQEEILKMRGTYTDNSEERKQIKLERDRRISKQKYINKKPTKTIIITCILNNPEKSDSEIANLLHINRTTVYRHRKDLNK